MKAIVKLNGWVKYIEIDECVVRSRHLELGFSPPMSFLFRKKDVTIHDEITRVTFRLTGQNKNNIPIFEYY